MHSFQMQQLDTIYSLLVNLLVLYSKSNLSKWINFLSHPQDITDSCWVHLETWTMGINVIVKRLNTKKKLKSGQRKRKKNLSDRSADKPFCYYDWVTLNQFTVRPTIVVNKKEKKNLYELVHKGKREARERGWAGINANKWTHILEWSIKFQSPVKFLLTNLEVVTSNFNIL